MAWPDDLAAELPEPNPDEPKTLRDDILDELRDHLQSSLELEQLRGTPEHQAEEVVLSRFGNPVQTARQLWWDAMKGRIMSQRITLGLVIVLCLLSVAATAMLWQTVQQGQQTTAAMIAELKKLNEEKAVPGEPEDERLKYLDWIPVTVKLTDEVGKPITEPVFSVEIDGENLTGISKLNELKARPDENGVVDFGFIKPGMRQIRVSLAGASYLSHPHQTFRSGEPVNLEITCPREYFKWQEKEIEIRWPEDLSERELWLHVALHADARVIDRTAWVSSEGHFRSVLIDPHGKLYLVELFQDQELSADRPLVDPYPLNLLEFVITGEMKITGERAQRWGWQTNIENYRQKLHSTFQTPVYADLSESHNTIPLVGSGMSVYQIRVLRMIEDQPATDHPAFLNVLPTYNKLTDQIVAIQLAAGVELTSDKWVYEPSDLVVDLVRKRLEQIEAEKKPEAETATTSK